MYSLSPGSLAFLSKSRRGAPSAHSRSRSPRRLFFTKTRVTLLKSSEKASSLVQTKSIYRPNFEISNFRRVDSRTSACIIMHLNF